MLVDARTTWLEPTRNFMAVALSPIQALASVPAATGAWIGGVLSAEPNIKIAHQNLRKEYFQLKSETLLLRTLQEENEGLRSLLDASQRLKEKVTLAELMKVNIDQNNHRVMVGRGIRHGVYAGQAVIDDRGVIGQVTDVMPFNSKVMLITDPGHAMPVQVQRTGSRTVVYGTGSVSVLRVPFLNQNADIQVGDVFISSGLGGRFPNGYPVAEVTKVEFIQDEAFMRVSAKPIAKLDRANHVLLLSRERPEPSVVVAEGQANTP
ncbi:MAG: rod shape-determining protein MreC [Gammaproteobacteria bacterium]|nr:rod shape-determining protein MreC [Gammaproteobacteria bacterium]